MDETVGISIPKKHSNRPQAGAAKRRGTRDGSTQRYESWVPREGASLNPSVSKSSGLDRIDEKAVALVQRVFPMQFGRSLDRAQTVMRSPITYSCG